MSNAEICQLNLDLTYTLRVNATSAITEASPQNASGEVSKDIHPCQIQTWTPNGYLYPRGWVLIGLNIKYLALLSKPIRSKTTTNRALIASTRCSTLGLLDQLLLWLASVSIVLWFWFYNTQVKTALLNNCLLVTACYWLQVTSTNFVTFIFRQILINHVTSATGSSAQTICVCRITGNAMAKMTAAIEVTVSEKSIHGLWFTDVWFTKQI